MREVKEKALEQLKAQEEADIVHVERKDVTISGVQVVYTGDWSESHARPEGKGCITLFDGRKLQGRFVNGLLTGESVVDSVDSDPMILTWDGEVCRENGVLIKNFIMGQMADTSGQV